jgi:hypothetical protein
MIYLPKLCVGMIYLPKLCVGMIYLPKLCVGLVYSGSLSCGDTSNNFFQFYMAQFLLFRPLRVTQASWGL